MKIVKKIFFISLILLSGITIAQKEIKFESILNSNGVATGTINTIFKDSDGLLWLGTNNGLQNYNGYSYKIFNHDFLDSFSISGNEVWGIAEDSVGNFWVGTLDAGLNYFDKSEGKFYKYNIGFKGTNNSQEMITSLIKDLKGNIWISVWENGLAKYDMFKKEFKLFLPDTTNSPSTGIQAIQSLCYSNINPEILWVGTKYGLRKFDLNSESFISSPESQNEISTPWNSYIRAMCYDSDGMLWIGSQNENIWHIDPSTNQIMNSYKDKRFYVLSIIEDDKKIWVGTDGAGISIIDVQKNEIINYQNIENNSFSIPSNAIRSLFIDKQKIIWLGTSGKGLVKSNPGSKKFNFYSIRSSNKDNFVRENVTSVYEGDLNNIWIGTGSGELYKFDALSASFKSVLKNKIKAKIHTIVKDRQNRLWIGSLGDGIRLIDLDSEKLLATPELPDHNFAQGKRITKILEDKKGNIWIGTDGAGLIRFDSENNKFENLTFDSTGEFSSAYIWTLFEDSNGIVWIGTWDYGVSSYDYSTSKFTDYIFTKDKPGSIAGPNVVSITEDQGGNLWFGTWGNGFSILSKDKIKNPYFINYGTESGIPNNFVIGLLPFSKNKMWVITTAGITLVNIKEKTWNTFSEKQGVFNSEFNLGSLFKTRSGKYCFGAINGLYITDESLLKKNEKAPSILITSVKLFDKELKISKLSKKENNYEAIELSYDENFLYIEFVALDYIDPDQNRFMYKMEGLDKYWIKSDGRNFVSYAGLSPGKYTFRVKGTNSDLIWNENGASIPIIIKPPFWQTWWAYTIYVIALICSLYFIRKTEIKRKQRTEQEKLRREREESRLREAELKAKNLEQEQELEKQKIRNRIAQDLHDEIGSNLSSISLMSELVQKDGKINTEALEKMNRIQKVAKGSAQAMRDIVWLTNPSSDNVKDLISKMNEVANDMLGGLKWNFDIPKEQREINLVPETKRNFFFIYKEALNNIVKHSGAEKVKINLSILNDKLVLQILDDGKGFDKNSDSRGNGLKNMQNRATEINGRFELQSHSGEGTNLVLEVNITQSRD